MSLHCDIFVQYVLDGKVTIQYNLLINSPTGVFQNQFTCNDRKKE